MNNRHVTDHDAPIAARVFLIIFAVVLAFCGGSSRHDLMQIVVMIPVAILSGAAALYFVQRPYLKPVGWAFGLGVSLAVLMLLQLIPLSHGLWASLPGRAGPAALDTALGLEPMRAMSLNPARTLHALFTTAIPIAAILLFVALRDRAHVWVFTAIVGIAVLNAIVGILQELGGNVPLLYFYAITIAKASVGIFANPNHASVFGALALIVIALGVVLLGSDRNHRWCRTGLIASYVTVVLANFINTSRAGLLTTLVALVFTALLFLRPHLVRRLDETRNRAKTANSTWIRVAIVGASVTVVIALVYLFERSPAVAQLLAEDPLQDLRFLITPTLIDMVQTYFPLGAGFGAFENIYYIAEERNLLMRSYLNNAHNDWLQWVIEGGLPAALLLLAFFFFVMRALFGLWRMDTALPMQNRSRQRTIAATPN
ncbi:MAG: O-antigen ligase family protein, partial [Pontixanthobacter sp.]